MKLSQAENILVYAKADRSISLVPAAVVTKESEPKPLKTGNVARAPWKRSVDIPIPATAASDANPTRAPNSEKSGSDRSLVSTAVVVETEIDILYTSVIVYDCIAKHMTWKRLTGNVKHWQVVDHPFVIIRGPYIGVAAAALVGHCLVFSYSFSFAAPALQEWRVFSYGEMQYGPRPSRWGLLYGRLRVIDAKTLICQFTVVDYREFQIKQRLEPSAIDQSYK